MGDRGKRGESSRTVLSLGLAGRGDDLQKAMLESDVFDLSTPHGVWLRKRYCEILPAVMPDVLHCLETGDLPCLASLETIRSSAVVMRNVDVPLTVVLRGGVPALRVFSAFVQSWGADLSVRELTILMGRAALIAHELGARWAEAWADARERPDDPETATDGESLNIVALPGTLESPALEMLTLVASGQSNEQIAEATAYSPQAVKWHLARVMRSWKVGNRASLVSVAFLRGVLTVKSKRSAHPAPWRED